MRGMVRWCRPALAVVVMVAVTAAAPAAWAVASPLPSGAGAPAVLAGQATPLAATLSHPQVGAGAAHTCGVRTDGTVACWGLNADARSVPPAETFTYASAGGANSCGLRTDGTVTCWGFGGQASPSPGTFTQLSTNGPTCAVRTDGTVACWGPDSAGQASPPSGTFTQVSAGVDTSCGVRTDGTAACWGSDSQGRASPPSGTFIQVSVGWFHACGLRTDGYVACWGSDSDGQSSPPPGTFTAVEAGDLHTCGLRSDGTAACWGSNTAGQANPPPGTLVQISTGSYHNCAVRTEGTVTCWGNSAYGEAQPRITSATPGGGALGVAYSHTFTTTFMASAAAFAVTDGSLPPGLSLSSAGVLSGTPSSGGSFGPITVSASNGLAPVATQTFTIVVSSPTAATETTLTSSGSPSTYGEPMTFTATVTSDAGTPTGAVTITEGTSTLCADVPLDPSGAAACVTSTLGAGNHTITAAYTPDSSAFSGSSALLNQTVSQAPLTVTASGGSMTYGGVVPTITPSYSGFVGGDDESDLTAPPVCSTTATSTSAVGEYSSSSCGGAEAANYTVSYVDGSVVVNPAGLTVTASGGSMTYGGMVPTITPSYSGFAAGDDAADLASPAVCSTVATSVSGVGEYSSSCGGAEAGNYTVSYVDGSVVVNPAGLTVTASGGSMTYGGIVPTITPSYEGFVNGEDPSVLTSPPVCSTTATSTSGVGAYSSSCSGAGAGNYTVSYVDGSVVVNPAGLTVTASGGSMTYGGIVPTITPSYEGFVNGEDPSVLTSPPVCSTTATSTSGVGAYSSSCSGAGAGNYTVSYVDGSVVVNPAGLTVTASGGSMTYGGIVPTITPSYEGFVNGEGPSVLTSPPVCSTTATSTSGVGAHSSSCGGAVAANYTVSYVDGAVVVNPAGLTVTASGGSMTYGGMVPTITPSYSGFAAGDDAADLASPAVCSTTATSTSAVGEYSSSCGGAVAANYTVSYVGGSVVVSPAGLTVTASGGSMTYGGMVPSITPGYEGFVNGDDVSDVTSPPVCSTVATSMSGVGAYSSSCGGAVAANYTVGYVDGSVVVNPAGLTVTASGGSMTYGGMVPTITPSYEGFVNGEGPSVFTSPPACSTVATSMSGVGGYASSCSGAAATNYTVSYVDGTVIVNPAGLTVTASGGSMTYGGTVPTITPSYDGFVNGEGPSVLTTPPVCSTTATSTSGVGQQSSSCGGAEAANYTVSYVDGAVIVNPAGLTVTASGGTMTYGGTVPTITPSYDGFVNGEGPSVLTTPPVCSTTATSTSGVGQHSSSCGGAEAANYTVSYVDGTVIVNPATLQVVAADQSKVYGQPNPILTFHLDGFVNGEDHGVISGAPELSTTATPTSGVGSYPIDVAAGTLAAANYRFVLVDGTLNVEPATLRVVADDQTRFYSQANPPLTYRFEGFVLEDSATTAVTGAPVVSTSATPASGVGAYPITISQGTLRATDYRFELVDGTLTVTPAPTRLVARPQVVVLPLRLRVPDVSATLTASDEPVAGQTVSFTTNGRFLCRAVTDADGLASCNPGLLGELAVILDGGYTAAYSGELNHQPSTDTVNVIVIA